MVGLNAHRHGFVYGRLFACLYRGVTDHNITLLHRRICSFLVFDPYVFLPTRAHLSPHRTSEPRRSTPVSLACITGENMASTFVPHLFSGHARWPLVLPLIHAVLHACMVDFSANEHIALSALNDGRSHDHPPESANMKFIKRLRSLSYVPDEPRGS